MSYAVLIQAFIIELVEWVDKEHPVNITKCWVKLLELHGILTVGQDVSNRMRDTKDIIGTIIPLMDQFKGHDNKSPTFQFWMTFLNTV